MISGEFLASVRVLRGTWLILAFAASAIFVGGVLNGFMSDSAHFAARTLTGVCSTLSGVQFILHLHRILSLSA